MTAPDRITAAGLTIRESRTTPTKPGKAPRAVWIVDGITEPYADTLREIGGHRWRGTWSFWTDPTVALSHALETTAPASYAERMEAAQDRAAERADRYQQYATNAERRAEAASHRARSLLDPIPFGQPILVGHHSERRHRRTLDRADRAMRRSVEEHRKAEYLRGRALTADRTASGDHSAGFIQRRIEDAETTIRQCTRQLTALDGLLSDTLVRYSGRTREECEARQAERRAQVSALKQDAEQKRDYWRGQLEAIGGVTLTRETISAGDEVLTRHGWAHVTRANPKTVSVNWTSGPLSGMTAKYPYAELTGHRAAKFSSASPQEPL